MDEETHYYIFSKYNFQIMEANGGMLKCGNQCENLETPNDWLPSQNTYFCIWHDWIQYRVIKFNKKNWIKSKNDKLNQRMINHIFVFDMIG